MRSKSGGGGPSGISRLAWRGSHLWKVSLARNKRTSRRSVDHVLMKEACMKGSYTYKPVQFFLITNSIMWASWLTAARLSYRPDGGPGRLISVLELVGFFSPFVTALWMIFTSKSAELKRNCYEKLIDLRLIKLWSIPAILLLMPAAAVVSIVLSHLFFGQS